jgi:hypothetical protein
MKASLHGDIHVNCHYKLLDFNKEKVFLQDVLDGDKIELKRFNKKGEDRLCKENFSLPYCRTGHSIQGASIDGNVIIFDSAHRCVTSNWLYVVLTRARNLDRVYVVQTLSEDLCDAEIAKKLRNYQQQDVSGGRALTQGRHIRVQDVREASRQQGHCCALCGGTMNFVNRANDPLNWSIDRINDSLDHNRDNFVLSHVCCNVGHSDVFLRE